jgi:arylsulfatase A-like enzyme
VKRKYIFFLSISVLGALGLALYGCGSLGRGAAPDTNILLIAVDTLRADRLGCYGYREAETPSIDSLAENGILFERDVAQATETGPSFASILTGRYTDQHGVILSTMKLPRNEITLPEVLRRHHYATGAFVSCSILLKKYGLQQGFATYDDRMSIPYYLDFVERPGDQTTAAAVKWLRKNSKRRFFLMVHYFDPHAPYKGHGADCGGAPQIGIPRLEAIYQTKDISLLEKTRGPAQLCYDREIAFTDRQIGVLLAEIERLGLKDKTSVVFTADHGEEQFEHNYFCGHTDSLYNNVIRVPFIITPPGGTHARRITQTVESIDIMPTILGMLGIAPPKRVSGRNLAPLIDGSRQPVPHVAFSHMVPFNPKEKPEGVAVVSYPWKYIWLDGKTNELYNLQNDPGEKHSLLATEPKQSKHMMSLIENWAGRVEMKNASKVKIDESSKKILKDLGYIH